MTAPADSAELAPSRNPAAYGGRRPTSRGFWAMMAFGAACMAGAAALVLIVGPRVHKAAPAPGAPSSKAPLVAAAPAWSAVPPASALGAPVVASGEFAGLG